MRELALGLSLDGSFPIDEGYPTSTKKNNKEEWAMYFLEEKPNYNKIDRLDFSERIQGFKDRYEELSKFKKVAAIESGFFFISSFVRYAKDNPDECRDVVLDSSHFLQWDESEQDQPYFKTLTIVNDNFGFVYRRNAINDEPLVLLFFNDENYIHDTFYKEEDIKYSPGIYELAIENNKYTLKKVDIKYLSKPILDDKLSNMLDQDITCFFQNEDFYRNNPIEALPYKRGIIIYGPHGNGKTTFIKYIIGKYTDSYRLLVDSGMHFGPELFEFINKVFPKEGKKIIVFEDVESISQGSEGRSYAKRSSFLNFIDGPKTMECTMFLATTNHIDLVDEALADRPSRFDKRYLIGLPEERSRSKFLVKFFPELKKPENKERLKELVKSTKDFSGAYFKELYIIVGIQKSSLEEAISTLSKQIKNFKEKKFDPKANKGIGLGIGMGDISEMLEDWEED
jgi:hypothetical protein